MDSSGSLNFWGFKAFELCDYSVALNSLAQSSNWKVRSSDSGDLSADPGQVSFFGEVLLRSGWYASRGSWGVRDLSAQKLTLSEMINCTGAEVLP